MDGPDADAIAAWVVKRGLAGASETELLHGFCARSGTAGLRLSRALAIIDTLHPIYEGRAFRWRGDGVSEDSVVEFGRTNEGQAAINWHHSAFFHLLSTGAKEVRRRIGQGDPTDFLGLEAFKAEGEKDYIALVHRFTEEGTIGEMDCVYSHWTTRHPDEFSETDLDRLRRLLPSLALALKCASLARIAGTLVEVYLGRDPGQRVLSGRISRGVADRITAVLWYSDLRNFTTISDTAPPDEIIPLLNDYAESVISAIHGAGGDVLKLMGDGILAIFQAEDPVAACRRALEAAANLRIAIAALNERRAVAGRPITSVYLGLHIGDVFYGNIGSADRLDFTVVGPAVNEVSRIASLCRSVDRGVVMSSDFVAATAEAERSHIVSVGRYALRGVGRAQELFTLDPALG